MSVHKQMGNCGWFKDLASWSSSLDAGLGLRESLQSDFTSAYEMVMSDHFGFIFTWDHRYHVHE